MKKLIIVVAISLLALAGCSSNNDVQPTNTSNTNIETNSTTISAGSTWKSYKIGTDIPAGEYYFVATGEPNMDYDNLQTTTVMFGDIPISEDPSDDQINAMASIITNSYVTIEESYGYLYLLNADVYSVDAKPEVNINSDGSYPTGMYKVGTDIPAGTYTIEALANSTGAGYIISSDSTISTNESEMPDNILSQSPIADGSSKTITVEDGQYLNAIAAKVIPE